MKRAALLAVGIAALGSPAQAGVTILRCHGEDVITREQHDIGVALDMEAKHVLDFGQGEGVETTDFTATTIKARLDPIGAQKNKHFRIRIRRLDGVFTLVTRVDETAGAIGAETRVKGTCEAAQRKF